MKVKIIRCTPYPITTIASAYAMTRGLSYREYCRKYGPEESLRLIDDCVNSGHMSGLEFVDIDFEILDCSRVFEVDKVRSRLASYEVEAGQFSEQRNFEMVIPPEYDGLQDVVNERMDTIRRWNQEDKERGIDPRSRRYFTYQGLSRRMRSKQNLRALIETGWNRFCGKAQWEYREFMELAKEEITRSELEPFAKYLVPKCVKFGRCNEKEPCGRFCGK